MGKHARYCVACKRRSQRGADHREQEHAAQNFLQRAAVHGDEEHRRQREGIDELIQGLAGGLVNQAEPARKDAAGHQPEDREHRRQNGRYDIPAGGSLAFRYRVFIHHGNPSQAGVAEAYRRFVAPN